MEELKSALEKALERAERLGRPSAEETRERAEEEYAPIGRTLADRYLRHGRGEILSEEAGRYGGEERGIVVRAALSRLVEAVELTDYDMAERALEGVIALVGREGAGGAKEKVGALFGEYREAEKRRYEEEKEGIEGKERAVLRQLGISGSALGEINLEASEAWQEISRELYSQFDARLQELKQQLLKRAQA